MSFEIIIFLSNRLRFAEANVSVGMFVHPTYYEGFSITNRHKKWMESTKGGNVWVEQNHPEEKETRTSVADLRLWGPAVLYFVED